MIAFDTNALIRMLIEDDADQAKIIKDLVHEVENDAGEILILWEVLIETVWVLESVYQCNRAEIVKFLEMLIHASVFAVPEPPVFRTIVSQYKDGGDFADLVIVNQAKHAQAEKLISVDKKLQRKFNGFVVES